MKLASPAEITSVMNRQKCRNTQVSPHELHAFCRTRAQRKITYGLVSLIESLLSSVQMELSS